MLARWDPFAELAFVQKQVFPRAWRTGIENTPAFRPPMDIYEDEKAIYVKADIPGVVPEDIDIEVKDNVLTLHGERKREDEEKEEGYRRVERRYGSFRRSFTLPDTVDTAGIDANYKNGVLTLTLPKRPESQHREIKVVAH